MNKRIASVLTIMTGLLVTTSVGAAFTSAAWQSRKPITVAQSGYVRLNLDAEVFAGLAPDLADLRVADDTGLETPYQVVVEQQARAVRHRQLAVYNNAYTPGQFQSFIVDLGSSGQAHNWLRVLTPEREFQQQVEIAGSDDQVTWPVLKGDGYIFAHHEPRRNFAVQETTLTYPTATFRYLRVRIFAESSFAVSGVEVTEQVAASAKEVVFAPTLVQTEDGPTQSSLVTLDFGQSGLPVLAVTLQTAASNFNRPVELYASNDASAWRPIGSDYVFRVATPKFRGDRLTLRYPELAARYLRLAVFNGDDQPVPFTGATARGILRSVVFNAAPGRSYFLYYGNPRAARPAYDLERLFPYLEVPEVTGATLGPEQANPAYLRPTPPVIPLTERYPWLLPVLLAVVALGLVAMIFRLVKQVKP